MSRSPKFASVTKAALSEGFAAIRSEFGLPASMPAAALQEAEVAAARLPDLLNDPARIDLRSMPFVTLDPASSVDLDQAFCLTPEDDHLVLHYAIADVGAVVPLGGELEREAFVRGQTIYAPDERVPQYPTSLSEGVASLLPDGPRPAIILEVVLDRDGQSELRTTYRAVIQSTAKLAYETTSVQDIPHLTDFSQRVFAAERARGALRVELPEQELTQTDDGSYSLVARAATESEEANSALSLAANLAVAQRLIEVGFGLFRVMDAPDERSLQSLRRIATSLGLDWAPTQSLLEFQRTLDTTIGSHRSFLVSARRSGGGASYATIGCGEPTDVSVPFHAAIGAAYSHVTAPLRRLADRYVLDLLLLAEAGDVTLADATRLKATFATLVAVMADTDRRANKVERAAIDLIEAVLLAPRVGEQFDAVVLEAAVEGCVIGLVNPQVRARLGRASFRAGLTVGQPIVVTLEAANPLDRSLKFSYQQDSALISRQPDSAEKLA